MLNEDGYVFIGKNKDIELTIFETKLLSLLLKHKGNIVTYEKICKEFFHDELDICYKKAIYIRVHRLKKKLKGELEITTRFRNWL